MEGVAEKIFHDLAAKQTIGSLLVISGLALTSAAYGDVQDEIVSGSHDNGLVIYEYEQTLPSFSRELTQRAISTEQVAEAFVDFYGKVIQQQELLDHELQDILYQNMDDLYV